MNGAPVNQKCVPAQTARAHTLTDQEKKQRACARTARWRKNNPEKKRQANTLWESRNKDKARESKRKWNRYNKEQRAEYRKAWRAKNRGRYLEQKIRNYERHRDERLGYARKRSAERPEYKANYEKSKPEKRVNNEHIRRAKKRQAPYEIINSLSVFEENKWVCQLCLKPVDKTFRHPNPLSPSLDHIVPFSEGGSHTKQNVQLAHLICNVRASTKKSRRIYG